MHEVRGQGVRVLLIKPGATRTEFENDAGLPDQSMTAYEVQRKNVNAAVAELTRTGDGPELVAQAVVTASLDPRPKLRYPVGRATKTVSFIRGSCRPPYSTGRFARSTESPTDHVQAAVSRRSLPRLFSRSTTMQIKDSVAFVTGSNRGLGFAFVQALLAAGASKVYAAARNPDSIQIPGVVAVKLDVTSAANIAAAAEQCGDVTLLINNAGISDAQGAFLLQPGSVEVAQREFQTNVLGPLQLSQAFAPILAKSGSGAILNVLSVLSWISVPGDATYSVSKAAAWSLTNGLRHELQGQDTQVTGLHVGYIDTDMARGVTGEKTAPEEVVRQALLGLEAEQPEVLADPVSQQVRAGLSATPAAYF